MQRPQISQLVEDFVDRVTSLVQERAVARARAVVDAAFPSKRTEPSQRTGPSQLQLHGRYVGRLRTFSGAQRKRLRAVRQKKGAAAALRLMDRL